MTRRMMKHDPDLDQHLGKAILEAGYAPDRKKMFGHAVYFLNGYMYAGATESGIFVHLSVDDVREVLAEDGLEPFSPMEGMTMKEYVILTKPVHTDPAALQSWLSRSAEHLLALPPKVKKPRRRKQS